MAPDPDARGLTPGRLVALSSVPATAWARIPARHCPVVLSPSSPQGWFGGRQLVAFDPVEVIDGATLQEAGELLEAAFLSEARDSLTAALIDYSGRAVVLRYDRGLVLADDGWRTWGAARRDENLPFPVESLTEQAPAGGGDAPLLPGIEADLDGRSYRSKVSDVADAIAAGDVYVLNLTYRLSGMLHIEPARAFEELVRRADSPMNGFLAHPGGVVASVSPERFLSVATDDSGRRIASVEPIKGTRPRGATDVEDSAIAASLVADEKERAEHVMIVDLERNDLGRVCEPGSVRVDPLRRVMTTPYCHQMVSRVTGVMRTDATIADALEAAFPCGSVTGAPKIAAMALIDRLETSPREAYCGALAVAMSGAFDSSVLIRTLEVDAASSPSAARSARWGTGCGITTDSVPIAEWLESILKAAPVRGDSTPLTGLRETCRVAHARVPLVDYHVARLASGGCGPTLLARVVAGIEGACETFPSSAGYGRLTVTVSAQGRVEIEITQTASSLHVDGDPLIALIETGEMPALPSGAAKPADRHFWDSAHAQARSAGAHQAVLVDSHGAVIDGSTATIWIRQGDTLLTPPSPHAIAGVAREVIFDRAASLGYRALEHTLFAHDIEHAQEVFLSNAVAGVVPVRSRGGQASRALASLFDQLFAGGSDPFPF